MHIQIYTYIKKIAQNIKSDCIYNFKNFENLKLINFHYNNSIKNVFVNFKLKHKKGLSWLIEEIKTFIFLVIRINYILCIYILTIGVIQEDT